MSYPHYLGQQTLAKTSPSVTLWTFYLPVEVVLLCGGCTFPRRLYFPVEVVLSCGVCTFLWNLHFYVESAPPPVEEAPFIELYLCGKGEASGLNKEDQVS